jgi:hypothetical protein
MIILLDLKAALGMGMIILLYLFYQGLKKEEMAARVGKAICQAVMLMKKAVVMATLEGIRSTTTLATLRQTTDSWIYIG